MRAAKDKSRILVRDVASSDPRKGSQAQAFGHSLLPEGENLGVPAWEGFSMRWISRAAICTVDGLCRLTDRRQYPDRASGGSSLPRLCLGVALAAGLRAAPRLALPRGCHSRSAREGFGGWFWLVSVDLTLLRDRANSDTTPSLVLIPPEVGAHAKSSLSFRTTQC
jgi:hypothetical protein